MSAARLDGDFVECGVNRGFLSSAIMELLDWDTLGKTFWLLDTVRGRRRDDPAARQSASTSGVDRSARGALLRRWQSSPVRRNFAAWKNVRIIVGSVPSTLDQIEADDDCLSSTST